YILSSASASQTKYGARLSIANAGHMDWDARRDALAAENPEAIAVLETPIRMCMGMSAIPLLSIIANRVCARTAVEPHGVCRASRKGLKKLSTLQAGLPFEWKQEVNRRIAEHRNRKGAPVAVRTLSAEHRSTGQRAAVAAARVAERFSHAPRYTETLVDDARSVSRAEEARAAEARAPEPAVAMLAQPAETAP